MGRSGIRAAPFLRGRGWGGFTVGNIPATALNGGVAGIALHPAANPDDDAVEGKKRNRRGARRGTLQEGRVPVGRMAGRTVRPRFRHSLERQTAAPAGGGSHTARAAWRWVAGRRGNARLPRP